MSILFNFQCVTKWRVVQNIGRLTILYRTQAMLFACSDFICQFILVSTHEWRCLVFNLFIGIFKDIPLLDCMGLQYPCYNCSFNLNIHIPRSVNLSSLLTHWFQLISSSSLDSGRFCSCVRCTWRTVKYLNSCPEQSVGCDWSRRVHDRERVGDRLDCVQDLQGIPESQGYLKRANFGCDWRDHTSGYHIHTHRIRDGIVLYPIGSARTCIHDGRRFKLLPRL